MRWQASARRESLTVTLFLGAFALALFWPLFAGQAHLVPFHILAGDPALQGLDGASDRADWRTYDLSPVTTFYAEKALAARVLKGGEWPLWNPCSGLGVPLLADGQSQPLAPFFLPFMAIPNPWVYSLCLVAQLLFGGLGMDRLLKALGAGMLARMAGAILFAFNPYAVKYLAFSDVWAYVWLPWLFLCAEWMARSGRGYVTMGVTIALAAMSGHPEEAFMGSVAAWLYYAVRAWGLGPEGRRRLLKLRSLAPAGLALLLSMWWVLPFLEWVRLSTSDRMHVFETFPYGWEAPFLWGSELLVPPLLLALAILGVKRYPSGLALLPATAWSLLLLFPVPQALQVALSLGFMSNRYGRSLAWGALVVLGALGLDSLRAVPLARWEGWTGLGLVAAWVACALGVIMWGEGGSPAGLIRRVPLEGPPAAGSPALWVFVGLGVILWLVAWWRGTAGAKVATWGMAALLTGGVLLMPPSTWAYWNRSRPALADSLSAPAPEPTGREWLPSMGGLQSLSPNLSAAWGVRDIRYAMPLTPRRLLPLAEPLQWGFAGFYGFRLDVLEMCGVSRLWTFAPALGNPVGRLRAKVFPRQCTRGFWVPTGEPVADAPTAIRRSLEQDAWRERVFLENAAAATTTTEVPSPGRGPETSPPEPANAEVRVLYDRCNSSSWEVDCRGAGWFILRDLCWPGWKVRVDGKPVPLFPADGVFRAVRVQAGRHVVSFRYRPASFALGIAASTFTIAGLLVIWLAGRRTARGAR